MATKIRSKLSKKNRYWIPPERYYELKHFCLQYPDWKREYLAVDPMAHEFEQGEKLSATNRVEDRTALCAERKIECSQNMVLIEECCEKADPDLARYIFKAVTSNLGYTYLKSRLDIHDLKTGKVPAHIEQLMIYAALFCLEYGIKPSDIDTELRIYQSDDILVEKPDPNDILAITKKIIEADKVIEQVKEMES